MKSNLLFNAIITLGALAAITSCSDFLDPYPSDTRDEEYILKNPSNLQGLIGQCYEYMPENYNDNEGASLDCATDNAVMTSTDNNLRRFATGMANPSTDIFATYWERDYKGIFNVNLFLQNNNGRNVDYMHDDHLNELLTNRLWGEAYALRAWFQWDLLQKFGGKGMDGRMLGYPIILAPVRVWEMTSDEIGDIRLERNTYEECVRQIVADCDSAYKYLPRAHRDFLVTDVDDRVVLGSQNWGRMDGMTAVAIKALVYLTWASPRFNPEGDMERWVKAAEYAKQVMDMKQEIDGGVSNGFDRTKRVDWFDPNNPEIIFAARYQNSNDAMERMFWPGGFQGNGQMGASQDLVDAFGMADGYPVGASPDYEYDSANPYADRDPRFYSNIFYNGRTVMVGQNNSSTYTFEMWENGGKDAAGLNTKNVWSNYYIKKFVYMGLNWADNTVTKMPHCKFHIRWTHMALAFAESANEIGGPTYQVDGVSAKDVMGWLRSRKTYDDATGITTDPYLDEIAARGKDSFREFIRNERRIETCFEGIRFFDLRRWSTTLDELNVAVHGAGITRQGTNSYVYDFGKVVQTLSFKSAYLPIPYQQMLLDNGLVQNEGWDDWQ